MTDESRAIYDRAIELAWRLEPKEAACLAAAILSNAGVSEATVHEFMTSLSDLESVGFQAHWLALTGPGPGTVNRSRPIERPAPTAAERMRDAGVTESGIREALDFGCYFGRQA